MFPLLYSCLKKESFKVIAITIDSLEASSRKVIRLKGLKYCLVTGLFIELKNIVHPRQCFLSKQNCLVEVKVASF